MYLSSSAKPPSLESELVNLAINGILSEWNAKGFSLAREFDYQRGRVDIIGACKCGLITAFEAKLTRWQDALHQAYRSTTFANFAYVLVPLSVAERASTYRFEFQKRGVGLIGAKGNSISIIIQAPEHSSLEPWLTEAALAHARSTAAIQS